MKKYYIGIMSGTSLDGIDISIVQFKNNTISYNSNYYLDYPKQIQQDLSDIIKHQSIPIKKYGKLNNQLASLYAKAVKESLQKYQIPNEEIIAIGNHGQTLFHHPNKINPFTLQLGNNQLLAVQTQLTTIGNFREKDMAYGGEGAPLIPAFHENITQERPIIFLNIGGIANISYLNHSKTIGYDTGPGNALINEWTQQAINQAYDKDGKWSQSGIIDQKLLTNLLADPYFKMPHPKSTGREYFNLTWLEPYLEKNNKAENIAATITELTARSIADEIKKYPTKKIICFGGGLQNKYLISRINKNLKQTILSSETLNIDPNYMESITFAWLAKQHIEKIETNMTNITGASKPSILGVKFKP